MELMKRLKRWSTGLLPINNPSLEQVDKGGRPNLGGRVRQDLGPIKTRPLFLEDRYQIVQSSGEIELIFAQLAERLIGVCDALSSASRAQGAGRVVLRQIGVTNERRPYLFMKPMSESGWLIETGPAGWRVSQAEQIISRELFMRRQADAWDVATVWKDPRGEGLTRVQSQRFGRELMTVSEYERRLCDSLKEIFTMGSIQ